MVTKLFTLVAILATATAWGSATRTLDGQQITNGAATLTLPSSTDTLVGRATTDTLTNKTLTSPAISGATISGATSLTDALTIVNATTSSKVLQFSLSGMSASTTLTLSSSQSTTQSLAIPNVSSGDSFATLNATQTFGSGSTWHGVAVAVGFGGTGLTSTPTNGQIDIGNGSGFTRTTLTAGSNITITNGSGSITIAASGAAPSLNGGSGSAESIVAATGVTLSSIAYENFVWVKSSTAGNTTVTATPSVTAGSNDGQILRIVGTDATKTVTLQDQTNLASSGLSLNGNWVGAKDSVLILHWDATQSLWVEDARR